ncbi:MAG: hypothetical protein ABI742_10465 [Gemmatimonadota bacterium]
MTPSWKRGAAILLLFALANQGARSSAPATAPYQPSSDFVTTSRAGVGESGVSARYVAAHRMPAAGRAPAPATHPAVARSAPRNDRTPAAPGARTKHTEPAVATVEPREPARPSLSIVALGHAVNQSIERTITAVTRLVAIWSADSLPPVTAGQDSQPPVRPVVPVRTSAPNKQTINQAAAAEPILIELQLGRIATRTVEAYRMGDQALVPISVFFELAEIRSNRRADGTIEAMVQPGNVPLVLEPASRTLRLGKEKTSLSSDQLVSTDHDIYVSTKVLARAFNLEWDVSWPDLQVAVLEPGSLPVARRIRRESLLRSQLLSSTSPEYSGLRMGLERSRLKGLVLDYSVLTPTTGLGAGAYSTGLGFDLFGGALSLGLQSQNGTGRGPRTEASWTGIWRESPWLSQVQLGDGISTGPRSRSLRGASISNSPYVRPSILGNVPFNGQLGAGWTVEAYRGGRLIGFDSVNALGQYSFDVPVQYGENPLDFVAYGPFGEVREFNQTYRLRSEGLPARRFEYGLSAGECRTTRCSATGNLDLRYGISTRLTARAGLDQFWRDSLGSLTHPYVGLLGSVTNAITVEAEAVGSAVLRGAIRYEPSVNLSVQAEAHRFARGLKDPILTPEGRLSQTTLSAFFRPVSRMGGTYLEASLDQVHAIGSDITSGRLGASFQVAEIRVIPAVRFQHQSATGGAAFDQTFLGVNTFVLPQPSLGKVLGSMTARTTLEFERGAGAASASAFLGLPLMRGLRAESGVTWFRGSRGPGFSLLIAAELPSVRSYTTVTAGGGTRAMGSQYTTGSAIYNPSRGSVDFSGSSALSRGGVTGRVFLDANGNGKFDADEQPLQGVRVVVGPTFAFSSANGSYSVWDVLPYEPIPVTVDSATLASPLWVPAFAATMIEPAPNRYRRLDIPVLPGGVIEGRVVRAAGSGMTGGIVLVLSHRQSGERRLVTTFGDGSFYAIGMRPGAWELIVDPKCLSLLHSTADALHFAIAPSVEGTSVEGLQVELR